MYTTCFKKVITFNFLKNFLKIKISKIINKINGIKVPKKTTLTPTPNPTNNPILIEIFSLI